MFVGVYLRCDPAGAEEIKKSLGFSLEGFALSMFPGLIFWDLGNI